MNEQQLRAVFRAFLEETTTYLQAQRLEVQLQDINARLAKPEVNEYCIVNLTNGSNC